MDFETGGQVAYPRHVGPPRKRMQSPTPGRQLDLDSPTASESRLLAEPVDLDPGEKTQMLAVLRAINSGSVSMLFRLPRSASQREIKRAYFGLSRLYHPDRYYGRALGSFGPILERIFATLSQYVRRRSDARALIGGATMPVGPRRRRHERHRFAVKVAVRVHSRGTLEGHSTYDVGWGGLFIATENPPAVGERLDLRLIVPGAPGVTLPGRVTHARRGAEDGRPAGMGILVDVAGEGPTRVMNRLVALARRGITPEPPRAAAGKHGKRRRTTHGAEASP